MQKKSWNLTEVDSYGLKKEALYNIKVQNKEARADVEAAASYPEHLDKIMNEGGNPVNNRFSMYMKQPSIGKRCYLGLS